jgi:Methyltransferase domain
VESFSSCTLPAHCRCCSLGWAALPTHDRDYVTQVNRRYHDAVAGRYDQRFEGRSPEVVEWIRSIMRREVWPILDAFGSQLRVLDVGCGSGYLEGYLEDYLAQRQSDLSVLGLDISEGMLARARARFSQWRFEQADLYAWRTEERYHLVMENAVPQTHGRLRGPARQDGLADPARRSGLSATNRTASPTAASRRWRGCGARRSTGIAPRTPRRCWAIPSLSR